MGTYSYYPLETFLLSQPNFSQTKALLLVPLSVPLYNTTHDLFISHIPQDLLTYYCLADYLIFSQCKYITVIINYIKVIM